MKNLVTRVIELTGQIQQIPAPTFEEKTRAEFIYESFVREGLEDVWMDDIYNVFGRLPGKMEGPPLIVSAHQDTVFPFSTPLDIVLEEGKISAPGIGDNSLGVAGLFALIWLLRKQPELPTGDIWLVANTREEGLGDLGGMQRVVERFGGGVRAYLILEGMALGQVYNRGLGVRRYRITAATRGGHSWVDYGTPSAIHELAGLVTRLAEIELPRRPRTTLNVGTISGGTSINTIAPRAQMELDLRSENPGVLTDLEARVDRLVKACSRPDVQFHTELIGSRPAGEISPDHPLMILAKKALQDAGVEPLLNIGSTDANVPLSLGYPAVTIGLTNGFGAHTVQETLFTAPIETGMRQLENIVRGIFSQGGL